MPQLIDHDPSRDPASAPFSSVLVANRGEIACRVIRSLRALGIRSIAVYSDADRNARHVLEADTAVRIGPAAATASYLDIGAVIGAAIESGAEAIHPGYGFLSENAGFARACADAGLVFIGPDVPALEIMGDKIRSKAHVAGHGVPVVPGTNEAGLGDEELLSAAARIGFPLLVKPSAGGGGKGMRVVLDRGELPAALSAARRIATGAFGNDDLLLERLIASPRHIEVQVLADTHGNVIHLGERECSLQRRHQKVIEEAPSPLLDAETRARIGDAACAVARSVDYRGAGTVEFLIGADAPEDFFFIEMNARLQVEHPVTELVTGIDLVEWQLRIAAGEPLTIAQHEVTLIGHAVEARVYAEDPARGFLPGTGTILGLVEPAGAGVRIDSSLLAALPITADYDPMLSKVIAFGSDRAEALARLDTALARTVVLGVHTNLEYLRLLLAEAEVQAGDLDTGLIERRMPHLAFRHPDVACLTAAVLYLHAARSNTVPSHPPADTVPSRTVPSLWHAPTGWRLGENRPFRYSLGVSLSESVEVFVSGTPGNAVVTIDGVPHTASLRGAGPDKGHTAGRQTDPQEASIEVDGISSVWQFARHGDELWLGQGGFACRITVRSRAVELADALAARVQIDAPVTPELRSPMPGTVVAVGASTGDTVASGHVLVIVEAMKMEHALTAPVDGLATVVVTVGDLVKLDQIVATITASDPREHDAGHPTEEKP